MSDPTVNMALVAVNLTVDRNVKSHCFAGFESYGQEECLLSQL